MTTMALDVRRVISGPPEAPPVVLVHSLGASLETWDALTDRLSPAFRVVRYDLPGHGGTPAGAGSYSMAGLATDLAALLDELGLARVHVVGASIGGMIAMQLALDAPDRVDRLVLSGTSARLGPASSWEARADLVIASGMEAIAGEVAARWVTPEYAASRPTTLAGLRAIVSATDPAGYAGCCRAIARMDLTHRLGEIHAPALVLIGDEDPAIPLAHAEQIVAGIENSRLVTVPDAAHLPDLEQPDLVASLVAEHLRVVGVEARS
jgi:3-oxoadipate enol-lactonase